MGKLYHSHIELDRELKHGVFNPVYFFYGEDEFFIKEYESRIKNLILESQGASYDLLSATFYAGDDPIAQLINSVRTMPMLGGRKVVVLRNAERLTDKEVEYLNSYLENPSKNTILIITARGVGRERSKELGVFLPPGKLKDIMKHSAVFVQAKPREVDVRRWVVKRLNDEGKKIHEDALDMLIDCLGQDISSISREVEKLLIYLGDENEATLDDIGAMIPHLTVHSIFEFTDALSNGNVKQSLDFMRELTYSGTEPYQILPSIRWHFVRLWTLKTMLDEGRDEYRISKELTIPQFRMKDYVRQARRIPHEVFRDVLQKIYTADKLLRSRSGSGDIVLDTMVLEITARIERANYTSA